MPAHKGQISNKTGKGGFADNPDNISRDGRPKHSPQYWLNQYGKLSNADFTKLLNNNQDDLTVNQVLAITHIAGARSKLDNRKDLFNRVDGMPVQRTEITGDEDKPLVIDASKMLDKIYGSTREMRKNSKA